MPNEIRFIFESAVELARSEKLMEAGARLREAAIEAHKSQPSAMAAWLLYQSATVFSIGKYWKEADRSYVEAIREAMEPSVATQLLRAWAETFGDRDGWKECARLYEQALQIDQQRALESLAVVVNLMGIANAAYNRDDLDHAEKKYREALEITCENLLSPRI